MASPEFSTTSPRLYGLREVVEALYLKDSDWFTGASIIEQVNADQYITGYEQDLVDLRSLLSRHRGDSDRPLLKGLYAGRQNKHRALLAESQQHARDFLVANPGALIVQDPSDESAYVPLADVRIQEWTPGSRRQAASLTLEYVGSLLEPGVRHQLLCDFDRLSSDVRHEVVGVIDEL